MSPTAARTSGARWSCRGRARTDRRYRRPDRCEIDVDFVLHGDERTAGPATAWARAAAEGDRVAVLGFRADWAPPADADGLLLAGDESALPAIAAILERLPTDGPPVRTYLEVGTAADRQPLARADGVTWLTRDTAGAEPLLAAVRAGGVPGERPYAWVAGERDSVRDLRRYLTRALGIPTSRLCCIGYWRRGGPVDLE